MAEGRGSCQILNDLVATNLPPTAYPCTNNHAIAVAEIIQVRCPGFH